MGSRTRDEGGEMKILWDSVIPDLGWGCVGVDGRKTGEVACDDLGGPGRGGRGGRICPNSAPLPDLMLVLPFSSPCLLQAPSFSLSLADR